MCAHVRVCLCHGHGQKSEDSLQELMLSSSHRFQESSLSPQAWKQVSFPTEPSHWPLTF